MPPPSLLERLRQVNPPASPLVVGGLVIALLAAFGLAYWIGWGTAKSTAPLARAQPLLPRSQAVELIGLARATPLPPLGPRPAPRTRRAQRKPPASPRRPETTPVAAPPPVAPPPLSTPTISAPPPTPITIVSATRPPSFTPQGAASTADRCTLWASPQGDDSSPGTSPAPFRTVTKLAASLTAGQTGCLAARTIFTESVRIERAGIRLESAPGHRALIQGGISVARGADRVRLSRLVVRGADAPAAGAVVIAAHGVELRDSDISGTLTTDRSAPCILVSGSRSTVIEGNKIHNCTRSSSAGIYAAGIVVAHASGTTIRDNIVYHTVGDAIALTPNARRSLVEHNLIDGNVNGVLIGGRSKGNRIVNNIVSFSGRYNVHSSPARGFKEGRTNVVAGNCLWRGYRGNLVGAGQGFRTGGNLFANPRYINRPATRALKRGPCFDKRPAILQGTAGRVLPDLDLRYELKALPASVKVVRLRLTRLIPGTRVELRCVRRCRVTERIRAGRAGTATSKKLRGRSLRRGSVVEIRARRPSWIGRFARITVTGIPDGVRVTRACLRGAAAKPVSCRPLR